ncbi:MAG: QueT transporter family protein [Clostridia bacterium]|nr:QueT transporter family protein [Clostridia bacterium]
MKNFSTKRLCRAGIIAALYVALTYAFMPFAFGPFQIRPAEALCILPLFYVEAIPALWIGCMIANVGSPFFLYDVCIGSLATLFASIGTFFVGRILKRDGLKIVVGGFFPVILNALIIPFVIVFLCGETGNSNGVLQAYLVFAVSIFVTESVWVWGLGTPLYFVAKRLLKKEWIRED